MRQTEKYEQGDWTRNQDMEELKTESVLTKTLGYWNKIIWHVDATLPSHADDEMQMHWDKVWRAGTSTDRMG